MRRSSSLAPTVEHSLKSRYRNSEKTGQHDSCSMVVQDHRTVESLPTKGPHELPGLREASGQGSILTGITEGGPRPDIVGEGQGAGGRGDSGADKKYRPASPLSQGIDQRNRLDEIPQTGLLDDKTFSRHIRPLSG